MLHKSMQWGLMLSLVGGLSGCIIDDQQRQNESIQNPIVYKHETIKQDNVKATAAKASYVSTEPTQKAVPGPKRAAAPQIPVIQ